MNKFSKSHIYCAGTGGIFIGHIHKKDGWLLCLAAGILTAVMIALFRTEMMSNVGIRQALAGQLLLNWKTSSGFLFYLLLCRGMPFYLLILLTLKTGSYTFFYLYFFYCGFSYGVEAVLLTMQYQLAGLPIFLLQILPQIFCYLPALYLGYGLAAAQFGRRNSRRAAGISLLLWTTGLLMEWYINPHIIRFGMRLFL